MQVYLVFIYDRIYECNVSEIIVASSADEAMKEANEMFSDGEYEALSAEVLTHSSNGIRIECKIVQE